MLWQRKLMLTYGGSSAQERPTPSIEEELAGSFKVYQIPDRERIAINDCRYVSCTRRNPMIPYSTYIVHITIPKSFEAESE